MCIKAYIQERAMREHNYVEEKEELRLIYWGKGGVRGGSVLAAIQI